jgi:hypothetical protein
MLWAKAEAQRIDASQTKSSLRETRAPASATETIRIASSNIRVDAMAYA